MSDKAFVLIVEPSAQSQAPMSELLQRSRYACRIVRTEEEAAESIRHRPPDVIITPWQLGNGRRSGSILKEARQRNPDTEMLVLAPPELKAQTEEALADDRDLKDSYILSASITLDELRDAVGTAARKAMASRDARLLREQVDKSFEFSGIIGTSEAMLREIKRLQKIARSKSTVLIMGETGTGKELFAQAIHQNSPRAGKPFKVLNCAAVSETLLESELFGHVKGAFTGAVADRKGLIQATDGGTLFLDEIGDMPLAMQAKLLRAIETGEVLPVGSNDVRYFDVRFVAATNRDLNELVRAGKFREDLFYRLHAHGAVRLPPLRERREDIPVLVHRFIEQANKEHETSFTGVTPEVMRKLMNHRWPGNVRELRNTVFRMCLEADEPTLDVDDLPETLRASTDLVRVGPPNLAGMTMADVEKLHIMNTLRMFGGNREKTAKALGIGARTLYRKLRDYGLR